jgi:hypothetical protein
MRSRRRSRPDQVARYVLTFSISVFVLAAVVLTVAAFRQRTPAPEPVPAPIARQTAPVTPVAVNPPEDEPFPAPLRQPTPVQRPIASPQAPAMPQRQPLAAPQPQVLPRAPEEKPIAITTDALRQEHALNEVAAEQKYRNRKLQVTGQVSMVVHEPPLVGIMFGSIIGSPRALLCEMDREHLATLKQVRPGQLITLVGTYMGQIQGDVIGLGHCRPASLSQNKWP